MWISRNQLSSIDFADIHDHVILYEARAGRAAAGAALRELPGPGSRAELGYWVGRRYQNLGHATTAARRVTSFGFVRLGLATIDAAVAPDNIASRRVLEKLGALRAADGDGRGGGRAAVIYHLRKEA